MSMTAETYNNPELKKGQVVTIFQISWSKGLEIEGKATIIGTVDRTAEHYMVRFHDKKSGKPKLGYEYERFVDREGQDNPQEYIDYFNKRLGMVKSKTGEWIYP